MALINGIYIHVTNEEVNRETELSQHSVENGADITDHAKNKPLEISLEGKIVSYTETVLPSPMDTPPDITAWISLVKRDGGAFDRMSFEYLNGELLHFENGVAWVDTGAIQYLDESGNPVDVSTESTGVYQVKFEVRMPYEGKVRIQNSKSPYCAFNIINKSTSGYTIQDYNADEEISDLVLSNTYNSQSGRVRTEFINYDDPSKNAPAQTIQRSAAWVLEQLSAIQNATGVVTYDGRNYLPNLQIVKFPTVHVNTVAGGANFTMTLRELRTAYNSYVQSEAAGVVTGGTQQISQGDNTEIWYDVQVGDSVYALVAADNAPYKGLTRPAIDGVEYSAMDWVMQKNPSAFDTFGDFSTFKAFEKILVGYR